jgi:aminomethyltransferase
MTTTLARTPLYDWHLANGAKLVDFAGWAMPVQYGSIVAEHMATRQSVGLFDVSHMGRFRFEGADAAAYLDRLITRRVTELGPGGIRYALITRDDGGVLDDVLVYHLADTRGKSFYQMVVNAGNRAKIANWLAAHGAGAAEVTFSDQTVETAMIAVQGPQAVAIAGELLGQSVPDLPYYSGRVLALRGEPAIISRTGYTGEDGVELIVGANAAMSVWELLVSRARQRQGGAAGLGARDTLRLEAALPLYGQELSESINPYQAGLAFAVDLEGRQFPGRDALARLSTEARRPMRVGLVLNGRRVPRTHHAIWNGDEIVGEITSGTFSPTLQRPIALGLVRPNGAPVGSSLEIDIRRRRELAEVVKLPFFRRSR